MENGSVKIITPTQAKIWLDSNQNNRQVKQLAVAQYAEQMRNGKWKLNGETIKFSREGSLLDGQHRLLACVKANVPFESFVIYDIEDGVFDSIDTGRARTPGDVLSVMKVKNPNIVASGLRLLNLYRNGRIAYFDKVLRTEIPGMLAKDPGIVASAAKIMELTKRYGKIISYTGVATFTHYLFTQADNSLADQFFEKVYSGENLSAEHPIYVLRQRLITSTLKNESLRESKIAVYIIKTWNADLLGKKITNLRFDRSEDAPAVVGAEF